MPTDMQISEAFARRKAYGTIPASRLRYILEQLECGTRTKFDEVTVSTANLTVEHIMPRKWAKNWPLSNGFVAPRESSFEATMGHHQVNDEAKALMDTRQRWTDTLGNLTLLTESLNPSIGNAAWASKREKIARSLLALNRDVAGKSEWSEGEIELRAAKLAGVSVRIRAAC